MHETLLWRSTTRFHNWKDGRFVINLLGHAMDAGIIERVDWFTTEPVGERRSVRVENRQTLPSELFGLLRKRAKVGYLEAGGDAPAPWSLHLLLPTYSIREQRVAGIGTMALIFEGARFEDAEGSARLADAFRAVHSPDDTEYSGIHWYDRWERLNYTTYNPAVTYTPMFSGVVWANFFGPGHLDQFDQDVLKGMPARDMTWVDKRGLFLMTDTRLADVKSGVAESRLIELTRTFREARHG